MFIKDYIINKPSSNLNHQQWVIKYKNTLNRFFQNYLPYLVSKEAYENFEKIFNDLTKDATESDKYFENDGAYIKEVNYLLGVNFPDIAEQLDEFSYAPDEALRIYMDGIDRALLRDKINEHLENESKNIFSNRY